MRGARYYNVQLFRRGHKVLSALAAARRDIARRSCAAGPTRGTSGPARAARPSGATARLIGHRTFTRPLTAPCDTNSARCSAARRAPVPQPPARSARGLRRGGRAPRRTRRRAPRRSRPRCRSSRERGEVGRVQVDAEGRRPGAPGRSAASRSRRRRRSPPSAGCAPGRRSRARRSANRKPPSPETRDDRPVRRRARRPSAAGKPSPSVPQPSGYCSRRGPGTRGSRRSSSRGCTCRRRATPSSGSATAQRVEEAQRVGVEPAARPARTVAQARRSASTRRAARTRSASADAAPPRVGRSATRVDAVVLAPRRRRRVDREQRAAAAACAQFWVFIAVEVRADGEHEVGLVPQRAGRLRRAAACRPAQRMVRRRAGRARRRWSAPAPPRRSASAATCGAGVAARRRRPRSAAAAAAASASAARSSAGRVGAPRLAGRAGAGAAAPAPRSRSVGTSR